MFMLELILMPPQYLVLDCREETTLGCRRLRLRGKGGTYTNQGVGSLISCLASPHAEVSLGQTMIPNCS